MFSLSPDVQKMRLSHVMGLSLFCLANVSSAQVPNLQGYRKGAFAFHVDKGAKKKFAAVTFFFGSGSDQDSILLFVDNRPVQTITPVEVYQDADFLKSSTVVHFDPTHSQKRSRVIAVSLKQNQYVSLILEKRHRLVRIYFHPNTSFVEKTNRQLIFE